jgi:glycosyltransferase involved in cell wall biosynthesis
MVKFSFIICTYNREDYIGECLERLALQDYPAEAFEVIVVDNNSTDGTTGIIKDIIKSNKHIGFRYFLETDQGLSYARNRGIKEAKGEVLIYLDDDAFASNDYLKNLDRFFKDFEDAAAFGGKIIPRFESQRPAWMSDFLLPLVSVIDLGDKVIPFPKRKFPIGANMGFTREIIGKVGDFNVNLGRKGSGLQGSEEKDIFSKITNNKGSIYYIPDVLVEHMVPDKRIQLDFIKRQAKGVGGSEKQRTLDVGRGTYIKRLMTEFYKWVGSLVLFTYYLLTFRAGKGIMILRFRWWVTSALL